MAETYLSQAIAASADARAAYDTNVKFLLADKQILARILKYAVEEFADMTIEDIIASIGDDVEIDTQKVDPGLSNTGRVHGMDTEDNVPGEGKVRYDLRFSAYHKREEMKFLINIEAQKTSNPKTLGYHLENRIIYYLARMISAQKQTEFYHSDYDALKKVRSIWICMDTGESNDSIEEIYLDRRTIFGKVPEGYHVDLLRGIIIRIRDRENVEESKNVLIAMLEDLLSQKNEKEKKQVLTEKYGMKMTVELEGRLRTMCNLSENIEEKAMEKGLTEGGAKQIIEMGNDFGLSESDILNRLQQKLGLSLQAAREYFNRFGKQAL